MHTEPTIVEQECFTYLHDALPVTDTIAVGTTVSVSVPPEELVRTPPRVIRWASRAPLVVAVDSITGNARALAIGDVNIVGTDISGRTRCRDTWISFLLVR